MLSYLFLKMYQILRWKKARKLFGDFAKQIMFALVRIFGISRLGLHTGQKIFLVMVLK